MKRPKNLPLLRQLIYSLIYFGKIKTTKNRAKAVAAAVDRLINKIKKGTLASGREVLSFLPQKQMVEKLTLEIVPKLKERKSGYIRLTKTGERRGDGSPLIIVEWAKDEQASVSIEENKPAEKEDRKEEKKVKKNDKTDKGK